MSGPQGRLTRDLFGQSLHILGKLVLDPECNLVVANSTQRNAIILGNVYTSRISERINGGGITLDGNVVITSPHTLTVDSIISNSTANIIIANAFIGNLFGDVVGTVFGDVYGDLCGNITTSTISGKTGNTVVMLANLIVDLPGTSFVSSVIFTDEIVENFTDDGISVFGNVTLPNYYRLNVQYVKERDPNQGINIQGNVFVTGNVNSTGSLIIDGDQVVTNRQPNIPYNSGVLGNVSTTVNTIIDVLRAHGLIG